MPSGCPPCEVHRIVKENPVFALKKPVAAVVLAALLGACSKAPEKVEDIRPVRAIVLSASSVDIDAEFPGEVRARVESRLAFRVPGKITARKVDPGTLV